MVLAYSDTDTGALVFSQADAPPSSAQKGRVDGIRVFIGIATSGRPTILPSTIAHLRGQTRKAQRIVICATKAADVEELDEADDLKVMYAPPGLPIQRNALLDEAGDDDFIFFFDDDFLTDPQYIERTLAIFAAQPDVAITTGRVLADGARGPGLSIDEGEAILDGAIVSGANGDPSIEPTWNGYGCNMAFRLAPIRDHGLRFDERLPLYAWYEDVDFSRRVAPYGRVVKINAATGVHLGTKKGRTSGKRLGYSQVVNPVYFARKGTFAWRKSLLSILRNMGMNVARSVRPEAYIDRRGRLLGNLLGIVDVIRGRAKPERILDL